MAITTGEGGWIISALWAFGGASALIGWRQMRRWSRKARVKRRLLVKAEDGVPVWHTVRGKILVGWPDTKGNIISGAWAPPADDKPGEWGNDWAVIQASKDKFVVYRFNRRVDDEPRTGVIQVCDSFRDLEATVPAKIFEEALLEAGIKKPSEYGEVPLKL